MKYLWVVNGFTLEIYKSGALHAALVLSEDRKVILNLFGNEVGLAQLKRTAGRLRSFVAEDGNEFLELPELLNRFAAQFGPKAK